MQDKHHQAYTDKFNEALSKIEEAGGFTVGPNTTAEAILRAFHSLTFPSEQLATVLPFSSSQTDPYAHRQFSYRRPYAIMEEDT